MTKEEILKSWDKYEIFSKTYFELAISAMQEYADQQTLSLKAEHAIEKLKIYQECNEAQCKLLKTISEFKNKIK